MPGDPHNMWEVLDWQMDTIAKNRKEEHDATVERIRAALKRYGYDPLWGDMREILDEEAARYD